MIRKNDGVTITAVERTVQRKGTIDNHNFQTQLIPCTSPVDDHATNGAVETMVHSLGRAALGVSIIPTSILPWLVRYPSYLRDLSCDQVAEYRLKS